MPHVPEDSSPENWHRYFAMECNNRAWELVAQISRTPAECVEMLNSAHASALHWAAVGTELNQMRAKTLLAEVHALSGFGDSALRLASEIRPFFLDRETEDWELAFVHTIYAHAAAVARDERGHRSAYAEAVAAVANIADDEDRKIVLQTFEQVPRPDSG